MTEPPFKLGKPFLRQPKRGDTTVTPEDKGGGGVERRRPPDPCCGRQSLIRMLYLALTASARSMVHDGQSLAAWDLSQNMHLWLNLHLSP